MHSHSLSIPFSTSRRSNPEAFSSCESAGHSCRLESKLSVDRILRNVVVPQASGFRQSRIPRRRRRPMKIEIYTGHVGVRRGNRRLTSTGHGARDAGRNLTVDCLCQQCVQAKPSRIHTRTDNFTCAMSRTVDETRREVFGM